MILYRAAQKVSPCMVSQKLYHNVPIKLVVVGFACHNHIINACRRIAIHKLCDYCFLKDKYGIINNVTAKKWGLFL